MTITSGEVQAVAVGAAGVVLLILVVGLTRRGLLSLRYGLGWLLVALIAGASAVLLGLVHPISSFLHMTPTGFMLAVMSGFLLLLALQLSISVSGLQDAVRDLSESNALLEERLRAVEEASP